MITREAGHWLDDLVSLGGVKGGRRGRVFEGNDIDLSTNVTMVFPSRPERISAIMHNESGKIVHLIFGTATSGDFWIHLQPYESFQIDKDFPWCGSVYCYVDSSAAGDTMGCGEVYLE